MTRKRCPEGDEILDTRRPFDLYPVSQKT